MERNLKIFYISFIFTLIISINCFPYLFFNTHSILDYIKIKSIMALDNSKNKEITIYNDKANIIIMMDDAWHTQYTVAFQYMKKYNMRGSIGVIPSLVGTLNYVSLAELYEIYAADWDLLNHTYTHDDLKKSNYKKQLYEIKKSQDWLEQKGFLNNSNILIYPYGEYNEDTVKIMNNLSIISGRSTFNGINPKIPDNLYNTKVKSVYSDIAPKEVYLWIDNVIKTNKTLILLFHKFEPVTNNSLMQYPPQYFYKIIDYLNTKKEKINIITYSEWIRIISFYKNKNGH